MGLKIALKHAIHPSISSFNVCQWLFCTLSCPFISEVELSSPDLALLSPTALTRPWTALPWGSFTMIRFLRWWLPPRRGELVVYVMASDRITVRSQQQGCVSSVYKQYCKTNVTFPWQIWNKKLASKLQIAIKGNSLEQTVLNVIPLTDNCQMTFD